MGIFDFLRKITKDTKSEDIKQEKIAWQEIENWLESKKKEIESKEEDLFVFIKARISNFTRELESKINIVKAFDVNAKKAEDRLKSATEEGRNKYILAVNSLIKNLNNIEEDKAEKIISNIDKLFSDFNKNSYMSYERATILIGKEMADLKNELKVFSKDMIRVFEENKPLIDLSKAISLIEIKLKQFEEIKKDSHRTNERTISLDKEIKINEDENKETLTKIDKIKSSSEYRDYLKSLEECDSLKEELKRDFISLTTLIDFRVLGNFYHVFEKEMEQVKSYRDKFQINFEKDNGKEILNLLNTAKLNTLEITQKIEEINHKKEILQRKIENSKDKTEELYSKVGNIALEIENLRSIKNREEKRLEKFKASEEEILSEIKKDLENVGVELIN